LLGAIYHVINRGDRQEDIYRDDRDRQRFLETLTEACVKTSWQVHAYCLMRNDFHLVPETPQANLVAGMKWFWGTYTGRFNRRYRAFGHLFSGRYKALVVSGEHDYLRIVCDYVHLYPVRPRRLRADEPLRCYRWGGWRPRLARIITARSCGNPHRPKPSDSWPRNSSATSGTPPI
jgi:putative transposase